MGITNKGLQHIIDLHRDETIWKRNNNYIWKLKDSITSHRKDKGIESVKLKKIEECKFIATSLKDDRPREMEYTLVGKGYIENGQ